MFRTLFLLIAASLFLTSCTGEDKQKVAAKRYTYPSPTQSLTGSDTGQISDRFYMIGWSEDGKLAYVNEPGDEACGCYFMDLYIIEAAKNEAVYHFHYNSDEDARGAKANDLAALWKQQEAVFTDTLNHYRIVPGNYIFTPGATEQTAKGQLRVSVAKTFALNQDRNINTIPEYRIMLHRSASVVPLYSSTPEQKNALLLDIYPAAVITEPSGKNVAVVTAQQYYGWEGPPNTLRYEVYTHRFK
jgi:hypothetical protein